MLRSYMYRTVRPGHRAVEEIIRLAKRCNAKIDRIDNKTLDRLTRNANHQGVMAKIQPIKLMKLSTAMYEADGNKKDLWLAVDEMTDPQNLGAIIRSAACPGILYHYSAATAYGGYYACRM